MSDEEAFQAALDANPDDHVTRLVFADWLQDRGDPRAEGYRALGVLRLGAVFNDYKRWAFGWFAKGCKDYPKWFRPHCILPADWFSVQWSANDIQNLKRYAYSERKTRREIEDEITRAFLKLPAARRAELLAQPATA